MATSSMCRCWCKKIDGKIEYLSRDYRTAKQKLKELIKAQVAGDAYARQWIDAPFSALAGEYLEDIKARRAEGTYRGYRYQLLRAMRILGTNLHVGQVRRIHLSKIEQSMTGAAYSPATIRDTIAAVQQVFSWAQRHDLLAENPLANFRKPASTGRTRLLTDDEFQALLRHSDVCFRRFLLALRMTGCRPGEIRLLTWEMVDLENGLWIFRRHKTVTMQREPAPRFVPLPLPIWRLCRRLAAQPHSDTDHVFGPGNALTMS